MKGVYLNVHFFLKQSQEGTIISVTTGTLGSVFPNFASYIPSKLAQTKVMEFLHGGTYTRITLLYIGSSLTIKRATKHSRLQHIPGPRKDRDASEDVPRLCTRRPDADGWTNTFLVDTSGRMDERLYDECQLGH